MGIRVPFSGFLKTLHFATHQNILLGLTYYIIIVPSDGFLNLAKLLVSGFQFNPNRVLIDLINLLIKMEFHPIILLSSPPPFLST